MKQRQRGFMVYDMVAAIGVLSVMGFGAFKVYHVGIRHLHTSSERNVAARALANEWERLRAEPLEGLSDYDGRTFTVVMPELEKLHDSSTAITVTPPEEASANPYQVTLQIDWVGRGGRSISESLTVLRAF